MTKKFELPQSVLAYSLSAKWTKDKLQIALLANKALKTTEPLYVVMHSRGNLQCVEKWNPKTEAMIVDKDKLPSGILHILLVNDKGQTLSERLIFCKNTDLAKVDLKNKQTKLTTRELAPIEINVLDAKKKPLLSNMSVVVVDNKDVDPNANPSILSTLLLTSDIRGYIAQPNHYFEDESKDTSTALDLVMLTHGWRRYDIPKVIAGEIEVPNMPIELGQVISGQVKSLLRNKPLTNSSVSIITTDRKYHNVSETDQNGRFVFQGFELPDSTSYILRCLSAKGSEKVNLLLDNEIFPKVNKIVSASLYSPLEEETNSDFIEYINKAEKKYQLENGRRMIYLSPIEIAGSTSIANKKKASALAYVADRSIGQGYIKKQGATSLTEALRGIAGLSSDGTDLYFQRSQANVHSESRPAAIYVDGVYIERSREEGYYDKLVRGSVDNLVDFDAIESIDIFNSAGATVLLGSNAASGAIMINTKKGYEGLSETPVFNIKTIHPLGYQRPAEFYSPKYETAQQKNDSDPDLRTTIYWNPKVETDKNGNAKFDFYTADNKGSYTMIVEGVSSEGKIVSYKSDLTIN